MSIEVATTREFVSVLYQKLDAVHTELRRALGRGLTLTEKILLSHLTPGQDVAALKRGESFILLAPDRVAMQDATAQMALLQFIQSGRKQVAVPSTVHCDHLIRAHKGVGVDMQVAEKENAEVFHFLRSASEKYGIGFWGPGAGIIHQVVLENYAFPGGLMIGTDSHTPNAGGLGMLAIGVGGADAVDVMAGMPWELLMPKTIGVKLTGKLGRWTSPKDVILKVLELLTVKGGTNKIVEYWGPGTASISCTGKGTIANMGAELGATTSVFPYDAHMGAFLRATGRESQAELADRHAMYLQPDAEVAKDPARYYDQLIEIDLDTLEPYIVGPHSPDRARPVSLLQAEAKKENYPATWSACLIGSCTNSSYEDIYKAAAVAGEALKKGLRAKMPFFVSPGSSQIFATIERDGLLRTLQDFGGTVLANACGPCIGQWSRDDMPTGQRNAIVTSFNRNFRGRNDSNEETLGFITSPEMVVAYAVAGDVGFDPNRDSVKASDGTLFKLTCPQAPSLPPKGFVADLSGYVSPAKDGTALRVDVTPDSDRLQLLAPFAKWSGKDFEHHLLLVKVKGKCTTDHISPAGRWLKFRGHLDHISDNMLLGAVNAFHPEAGKGLNQLTNQRGETLSAIARQYQAAGKSWIIVGDENYGEGSSREHAAMSPRYLGVSAVLVRSFARIHETNLKKQGVLALTFSDPADYEKIQETDRLSVVGLAQMKPGAALTVKVEHADGTASTLQAAHSYNKEQIAWFKAGSALNLM